MSKTSKKLTYHYLKHLRASRTHRSSDASALVPRNKKPTFHSKAAFRDWCADAKTEHVFYSLVEANTAGGRVTRDNPAAWLHGIVADYDAPVDWNTIEEALGLKAPIMPTWLSKTESGYMRAVWEFETPIPVDPNMFEPLMGQFAKTLKLTSLAAGFDKSCLKSNQYFELGEDWKKVGDPLNTTVTTTAVCEAASAKAPTSQEVSVPMEIVAAEAEARFPNRWAGDFMVGERGPLFWIDDGIDREGCQLAEDGVVCYSERAGKGFLTWGEIFGQKFIDQFAQKKMGNLLDQYWFNGKYFFKRLQGTVLQIPQSQLTLELRQSGFASARKKGKPLSEVEAATLTIQNQNRIDEIAPVVFSKDQVVSYNGHRILNTARVHALEPSDDGDPSKWPFLDKWLNQLFTCSDKSKPATLYFFAWLKRFYEAMLKGEFCQGQALILVGPTNRGKTLLSNKVIAGLTGGFSDASEYLSGSTAFNKDLGHTPTWVVDDTTSAASFQDQRRATELIKRAVANPRLEYMAKYADSIAVPWTGRVVMSLNMDANSLSVIPSMDSSNRDKLLALLIDQNSTTNFPPNTVLEATIEAELPHLGRWLLDWNPPKWVSGGNRFGVESYIESSIAEAAYDNSSRSSISELVDYFAREHRESVDATSSGITHWEGTLTTFQILVHAYNDSRPVGMSHNLEFLRRGMSVMEDACRENKHLRPVTSRGHGGGKIWRIDIDEKFDIK